MSHLIKVKINRLFHIESFEYVKVNNFILLHSYHTITYPLL